MPVFLVQKVLKIRALLEETRIMTLVYDKKVEASLSLH